MKPAQPSYDGTGCSGETRQLCFFPLQQPSQQQLCSAIAHERAQARQLPRRQPSARSNVQRECPSAKPCISCLSLAHHQEHGLLGHSRSHNQSPCSKNTIRAGCRSQAPQRSAALIHTKSTLNISHTTQALHYSQPCRKPAGKTPTLTGQLPLSIASLAVCKPAIRTQQPCIDTVCLLHTRASLQETAANHLQHNFVAGPAQLLPHKTHSPASLTTAACSPLSTQRPMHFSTSYSNMQSCFKAHTHPTMPPPQVLGRLLRHAAPAHTASKPHGMGAASLKQWVGFQK